MRLLRVIASMDPVTGGPCQGIRNLIPELEKIGVSNEVVSFDEPASNFLRHDPFPIHALGRSRGRWCYHPRLIAWLVENLPRFDAVIVHGLWLFSSHAVRSAARRLRNGAVPPVCVMPHGMLDPYFQRDRSRRTKALRNWIYWKVIESKVVNDADALLFTSEQELQLARESFRPYRPKREINVGYGVAEPPSATPAMREAFLSKSIGLGDRPYFLFLSRIHEKKGVDLLIRAYADVYQSEPASPTSPVLVIAGPLNSDFARAMQNLAAELCPRDAVFWPGMLSGDAKWGAFHGCEAFALPSHQENFGIAVAEALACGKPVLISNQVNIWREIEAAGGGVVAADSDEGVRENFQRWRKLSDSEKEEMGRQARVCHEKHFAVRRAAERLALTLQSLQSTAAASTPAPLPIK
jgi:glycosyltransferase involved in cell wall biosynthesis